MNELKDDHYHCNFCGEQFHIDELDTELVGNDYEYACDSCRHKLLDNAYDRDTEKYNEWVETHDDVIRFFDMSVLQDAHQYNYVQDERYPILILFEGVGIHAQFDFNEYDIVGTMWGCFGADERKTHQALFDAWYESKGK